MFWPQRLFATICGFAPHWTIIDVKLQEAQETKQLSAWIQKNNIGCQTVAYCTRAREKMKEPIGVVVVVCVKSSSFGASGLFVVAAVHLASM